MATSSSPKFGDAVKRDKTLCTFSKDGHFCPEKRLKGMAAECFCSKHQGKPRFIIIPIRTSSKAELLASSLRRLGHNANIWQKRFVVVGPTAIMSNEVARPGVKFVETYQYEDALMLIIQRFRLKLTHIVGQPGNPNG